MTLKQDWESFKKELTPNNIKIAISGFIPLSLGFYGCLLWLQLINPLLEQYSNPTTEQGELITLCIIIAFVAPVWPLTIWSANLGLWLGKVTKFYKYDKTRKIYFDDIYYDTKEMPQDQRDKIKEILSPYRRFNTKKEARKYKEEHAKTKVEDEV